MSALEEPHDEAAENDTLEEGTDYYLDGEYLVFTAAYHRKRGYCCGSNCRHCPYGNESVDAPKTET